MTTEACGNTELFPKSKAWTRLIYLWIPAGCDDSSVVRQELDTLYTILVDAGSVANGGKF